MLPVLDMLTVMGLSLLQFTLNPVSSTAILAFLMGITVLSGDALFSFDRKAVWRLSAAGVCMILAPEFLFALPPCSYKAGEKQQWVFPLAGGVAAIVHFAGGNLSAASLCLALVTSAAGWQGAVKSRKIEQAHAQRIHDQDSSRELSLLMEEKNKALRENQDYEIYTATLQERNRIAREIHDNVGHLLSRSILLAGAIKTINREESLRQPLENLEQSLNTAMTSIRSSVHDLHDEAVDLETAAREILSGFTFCEAELTYDMGRTLPKPIKYCFLAILKEALNNVMKHSNATKVEIRMREQPGLYQLMIRDNGTTAGDTRGNGIGLMNMAQRAEELGGLIRIHTDKGFEIFLTIPRRVEE